MPNKRNNLFGGSNKKAVNIQREHYSMATVDGNEAEIVLYGEIVDERPVNWWTGEPEEGSFIIASEFLEDLKQIEAASHITMRINSVGGNCYTSFMIHNRLRELKGELVAIVDGVAMSGGSLIMCAADKVQVNPSSLIMVHNCWITLIGGYNSDELKKIIASNETVDKAQVAIYKRKTGMSEEDIAALMGDETYMTGAEAVEKGFADELLDTEAPAIAASADCQTLYVNGRTIHMQYPLPKLPERIPTFDAAVKPAAEINNNRPAQTGGNKGGRTMAKTLEELRAENPELANAIMAEAQAAVSAEKDASGNEAVEAERQRIKEIDEISALYGDEIVQEAKYGKEACTAQELAHRAAKEAAKKGKEALDGMEADAGASGAQGVSAAPGPVESLDGKELTPAERMAKGAADAQAAKKEVN